MTGRARGARGAVPDFLGPVVLCSPLATPCAVRSLPFQTPSMYGREPWRRTPRSSALLASSSARGRSAELGRGRAKTRDLAGTADSRTLAPASRHAVVDEQGVVRRTRRACPSATAKRIEKGTVGHRAEAARIVGRPGSLLSFFSGMRPGDFRTPETP